MKNLHYFTIAVEFDYWNIKFILSIFLVPLPTSCIMALSKYLLRLIQTESGQTIRFVIQHDSHKCQQAGESLKSYAGIESVIWESIYSGTF
jgi:hypothetical protein